MNRIPSTALRRLLGRAVTPRSTQGPWSGLTKLAFLVGLMLSLPVSANTDGLTDMERVRVVDHRAGEIENWIGKSIENVTLMSVQGDRLKPIPFQINNLDVEGNIYFKEAKVDIDGSEDIVDANDRLVFMLADASGRTRPQTKLAGELIAELEMRLDSGELRYVYIVQNSRLRSQESYVRYAFQYHRVETDHYSITHSKGNALRWDEFSYYNYEGEGDPADRLTIEASFGLVFPFPRIKIANEEIVASLIAENNGPIQAHTLLSVQPYFFGIPIAKFLLRISYSTSGILYTTEIRYPLLIRLAMRNFKIKLGIDGNNIQGMVIRSSSTPGVEAVTDGLVSHDELKFMENDFDRSNAWITANSGKNLSIFSIMKISADERVRLSMYLRDELEGKSKTERYEGKGPEIGFIISDIPIRKSVKLYQWLNMADYFPFEDGEGLYSSFSNPLEVRVTEY